MRFHILLASALVGFGSLSAQADLRRYRVEPLPGGIPFNITSVNDDGWAADYPLILRRPNQPLVDLGPQITATTGPLSRGPILSPAGDVIGEFRTTTAGVNGVFSWDPATGVVTTWAETRSAIWPMRVLRDGATVCMDSNPALPLRGFNQILVRRPGGASRVIALSTTVPGATSYSWIIRGVAEGPWIAVDWLEHVPGRPGWPGPQAAIIDPSGGFRIVPNATGVANAGAGDVASIDSRGWALVHDASGRRFLSDGQQEQSLPSGILWNDMSEDGKVYGRQIVTVPRNFLVSNGQLVCLDALVADAAFMDMLIIDGVSPAGYGDLGAICVGWAFHRYT